MSDIDYKSIIIVILLFPYYGVKVILTGLFKVFPPPLNIINRLCLFSKNGVCRIEISNIIDGISVFVQLVFLYFAVMTRTA